MFTGKRLERLGLTLEILVCVVLVSIVSVNALRRMDYLGTTSEHIRMTDVSRTAYVAKNIAEGRGYTTNDLPAALVDFYAQKGKLHDEQWVNADRFPFAAYATAVLYKLTGSTSWQVGIALYNLLFFIGFLALLYATARRFWDDRYAGLFAVALALLHPYTFQFLYWKDGDMLFLTTVCIALLYRYYQQPSGTMSRWFAVGFGSSLAFLFLARPNLGAAFIMFVGISMLVRLWTSTRTSGFAGALKRHLPREGIVVLAVIVWCIPFAIHTMSEWGQPLFSANSLYQLPLGTRYGMGTDTWWKYTEPGHPVTFGLLAQHDAGLLWSKFPSSWLATLKNILASYPLEIALACGLFAWLGRGDVTERKQHRPLRMVGWAVLFAFVLNIAILPLYSFQAYSFRHYLAFGLPLLWMVGGRAISLLASYLRPAALRVRDHLRAQARWYVGALVVLVLVWNIGAASSVDANRLFGRTSSLVAKHWLAATLLVGVAATWRWIARPPWLPRIALLMFTLVYSCYRPNLYMKRLNYSWFPLDEDVWTTMKERKGLVSSFALQSEVAWNTGRKNIPAPEWPMHVYSFLFDHELEVEDLYIESADALISTLDGPFSMAAPGFEGYARLQTYRHLPGYEVAFHDETVRGYPKFRVKPRYKASTVFKLVDRAAVQAIRKSPDRIDLGDEKNAVYLAHGWERYATLEGKKLVEATNITRRRYPARSAEAPYEDASITFFLDQRVPKSIELEIYALRPMTFEVFWNLDLYAYDHPSNRKAHSLGTVTTTGPGLQRIRLDIPAHLTRNGINKLGFRSPGFRAVVMCPDGTSDASCLLVSGTDGSTHDKDVEGTPIVLRSPGLTEMQFSVGALYAGELVFQY